MSKQKDVSNMDAEELLMRISADVRVMKGIIVAQFAIALFSLLLALG